MAERRPGEVAADLDPGACHDATLCFIGHLETPWSAEDCPKNLRGARERGGGGTIHLRPEFAPALTGLRVGQPLQLLYWVDRGIRDLLVQHPRHADGPRGTFALRSPVRPNPIALATVTITALDAARGVVGIDAIDALDGTPVLDLKPWLPTIDVPPGWRPEG